MSISFVNVVRGCVWRYQYASAIYSVPASALMPPQTSLKSPQPPLLSFNSSPLPLPNPFPPQTTPKRSRAHVQDQEKGQKLTASALIFASSPPSTFHSLVRGISITPSMTACATCTPRGPNSRARLCARARRANFPVAKEAQFAEPLSAAVAEVKIRVGG